MIMIKQGILIMLCCVSFSGLCFAADATVVNKDTSDSGTLLKSSSTDKGKTAQKGDDKSADRFLQILQDDDYKYYLDKPSARWINLPNKSKEQVLDVWVKLVSSADKEYSYPETYLLEHYYIRPEKRQIQFLCELEVAGRPTNTVQQRPYDALHWEDLVPGSVEEKVYQAVIDNSKSIAKPKTEKKGFFNSDFLEETLRISL